MLTRFQVKGFKSLVDVSVDLGSVNIFIGANGSGKSNFLEAIGFLGAAASGKLDQEALRYRGLRIGNNESFRSHRHDQPAASIFLNGSDDRNSYRITAAPNGDRSWTFFDENIQFDGEVIVNRAEGGVNVRRGTDYLYLKDGSPSTTTTIAPHVRLYFALNRKSEDEKRDQNRGEILWVNGDFFKNLTDYSIFTPSTPQLRGFLDDIHHDPLGLGGSGLGQAIQEMIVANTNMLGPFEMDDILELIEWADEIGTNASEDKTSSEVPIRLRIGDRFMGNGHETISSIDASEGALYVLFLLALVGHEQSPRMFAIDNFDQALHPRLARELTELICGQILADGTRQMFATTHNPLVLDGLDLLDDRIRLFTVDRDEKGATKVERVTVTQKLLELADAGMSLSRLWTMGRLGGTPHNF